jgi:murein tripeptide amidase MpaA
MPELRFNTFYRYADFTALLQDFAAKFPTLCRVHSLGKSHEGRDIWCVTLTANAMHSTTATGPDTDKPAFWVDANIHATEVSPGTCALYAINKILNGYGTDEKCTRLLDTRALYIVPRFNPDGAELFLDERHRRIRSSTRPYPRLEKMDGLYEADVDGDGRLLDMRIKDPNGPWKLHPQDSRLLIPREADDAPGGDYYRFVTEGLIRNYDGVSIKYAPAHEGLDLNRNFPLEWTFESEQRGAGPYPTSEPEVRAVVQFIVDHPNITGAITFHTYSGVYLRPYGTHADDVFPAEDLWTFQAIGKKATELTGYPTISVFHDFKYHPKETIKGVFDDWVYDHLGVYAWTCELWSPQRQAGIEMKKDGKWQFIDWYRDHPVEDELKMLKWNDEVLEGKGFIPWYKVQHPQLGEVELGGWHDDYCWRNPPPHLLEKEVAPHADFIIWHALISPLLDFREVTVTPMDSRDVPVERLLPATGRDVPVERLPAGDDPTGRLYHIRAVIQNTGWLATNLSQRALEKKLVRPLEVELTLPDGATLVTGERRAEAGQLSGRALKNSSMWGGDPTTDRTKVEWVVRAPAGSTLTITASHQRAGKIAKTVTL